MYVQTFVIFKTRFRRRAQVVLYLPLLTRHAIKWILRIVKISMMNRLEVNGLESMWAFAVLVARKRINAVKMVKIFFTRLEIFSTRTVALFVGVFHVNLFLVPGKKFLLRTKLA